MIAWILKTAILLALFYLFFMLFMKKTTFFRFNRTMIAAGTLICLVLPLLPLDLPGPADGAGVYRMILPEVEASDAGNAAGFDWKVLILSIYAAGTVTVLVSTAVSLLRILMALRNHGSFRSDEVIIHVCEPGTPSFSFMNHILISSRDLEEHPEILVHEKAHVRCRHSADMLLMSLVCALQWFNPAVWLMRGEVSMMHEYEADQAVLDNGINASKYQLLLVRKAVGDKNFLIANSFNHSKLKNRIKMMQTRKTGNWARLAYLACLPLLFGALCFCSDGNRKNTAEPAATPMQQESIPAAQSEQQESLPAAPAGQQNAVPADKPVDYQIVDVKPTFNGGGANEFTKWVAENLKYPQDAKEAGISGRVYVQFTVNVEGRVENVSVLKGVSESLDNEVIRVVSSSPAWTPGYSKGTAVPVTFSFPVVFQTR